MKLKALAFWVFLLAASPAYADTTTLTCVSFNQSYLRKSISKGIENHIENSLKNVAAKVISLYFGSPDPDKNVVTSDYYQGINLKGDATTGYSISGSLASGLSGFNSTCKVKISRGNIKLTDGSRRTHILVKDLTVPGIYVPR